MKDEVFNTHVIEAFENAIKKQSFRAARELCDMFPIPVKTRVTCVKSQLQKLLTLQQDNDARRLLDRFQLQNKHVKQILLKMYSSRLQQDAILAGDFRRSFGLTIFDVGFMDWFFKEFLGQLFSGRQSASRSSIEQSPAEKPVRSSAA